MRKLLQSNLRELTKAIDLVSGTFDDYEREKRERGKIIKELKNKVSDLNLLLKT